MRELCAGRATTLSRLCSGCSCRFLLPGTATPSAGAGGLQVPANMDPSTVDANKPHRPHLVGAKAEKRAIAVKKKKGIEPEKNRKDSRVGGGVW
jgi:hypothetical protein